VQLKWALGRDKPPRTASASTNQTQQDVETGAGLYNQQLDGLKSKLKL